MRRLIICLGTFFLASLCMEATQSQTLPGLETNGCGSGRFGFLVPNQTAFTQCQFKTSCDSHDLCYGRCKAGGDLFGSSLCKDEPTRIQRRQVCDVALQANIITANGSKPMCRVYASIYRVAVQLMGSAFFDGISGNKPVGATQIMNLLDYLEANPDVFEPADLEKVFSTIAEQGVGASSYEFWLFKGGTKPPLFVVRQNDQELFKITGRVAGK
jgi:hypothetical protein